MQTKLKKESPYKTFKEWLLNPYPEATLPDEVLRAINPKSVVKMFGSLGGVTVYLDKYFNTYSVMSCDRLEFYKFLRDMVQEHKIGKYDFSFFLNPTKDKLLQSLHKKFPYLKPYEISILIESYKNDPDVDEAFLENLGLHKAKTVKIKKTKKTRSEEESKNAYIFENTTGYIIKTLQDYKKFFNFDNEKFISENEL